MLSVILQTPDFSCLTKPNTWEEKRLLEHTACRATGLGAEYMNDDSVLVPSMCMSPANGDLQHIAKNTASGTTENRGEVPASALTSQSHNIT